MLLSQFLVFQTALIAAGPIGEIIHVPAVAPTIQACIDAAVSGQDECVVAPGTYNELINFLGKAITVRSSHGREVTTIDGTGLGGSVVACASEEGRETILAGFTVRGGSGTFIEHMCVRRCPFPYDESDFADVFVGGGMYISGADPSVHDCAFTANEADMGGGVFTDPDSYPVFRDCLFSENRATLDGGGMCDYDGVVFLFDSHFVANAAGRYGGGMACNAWGFALVTRCEFRNNSAIDCGGGMFTDRSTGDIEASTFASNTAELGGGLFASGSSYPTPVLRSVFTGNRASFGGGAFWYGTTPIDACIFEDNVAEEAGGGLYAADENTLTHTRFVRNRAANGGGAYLVSRGTVLNRCVFSGNQGSESGGGIWADGYGGPYLMGSLVVGNVADRGGGVFASGRMEAHNTTIRGNIAHREGGGIVGNQIDLRNSIIRENTDVSGARQIYLLDNLAGNVGSCNVQLSGGSNNWDASLGLDDGGNIDADPLFVREPDPGEDGAFGTQDDDYGDSHLLPASPSIDTGNNDAVRPTNDRDLDGHARVLCGRVDMGAYESGIADFDCDQDVDLTDFTAWESCMLGPNDSPPDNGCESFDGNLDQEVDLRDFAIFQNSTTAP